MKTILVEFHNGETKIYDYPSLKALKAYFLKRNIKFKSMRIDWGYK